MRAEKPPLQNQLFSLFLEMGQAVLKGGSCAADEPFNGLGRDTEDPGNLGVAQSLIMPEDHGCSLVGRKGIERCADLGAPLFLDDVFRGAG